MLRASIFIAAYTFLAALSSPALAQLPLDDLNVINKDHSLAPADKLAMLSAEYERTYAKQEGKITHLPDDFLISLFKAADMLSNYSLLKGRAGSLRYVSTVNLVIAELEKRGLAEAAHYRAAIRTNISARQFQIAKDLAATSSSELSPSIKSLPSYGRRVIAIDEDHSAIVKSTDVDRRTRIVVVSGCNVASKAIRDIFSNSKLLKLFNDGDALWLMPPTSDLDLEKMEEWNNTYPSQPIQMAFDTSEWPEIDFSVIPNFYVFENGKVIGQVSGWNESETSDQLLFLLNKIQN